MSRGIISALTDAGYTVGDDLPIITGQDAELDSVKAIVSGEQYATIFKDTRELAKVAANMAAAILTDKSPRSTTRDYDNGMKVVPSYLLEPVVVTRTTSRRHWSTADTGPSNRPSASQPTALTMLAAGATCPRRQSRPLYTLEKPRPTKEVGT